MEHMGQVIITCPCFNIGGEVLYRYKSLFCFILVFVFLLNFIKVDFVYGEVVTMSAGLAMFLKAAYATGITLYGVNTAKKVTDEGIELYKQWQEFNNNKSPENKPPKNEWEKSVFKGLLGASVGYSFKNLVDNVKLFLSDKNSVSGENITYSYHRYALLGEVLQYKTVINSPQVLITVYDEGNLLQIVYGEVEGYEKPSFLPYIYVNGVQHRLLGGSLFSASDDPRDIKVVITKGELSYRFSLEAGNYKENARIVYFEDIHDKYTPKQGDIVNYYIDNNSYYITGDDSDINPAYPNLSSLLGNTYSNYDDLYNDWESSLNNDYVLSDTSPNLNISDNGDIKVGNDFDLPDKVELDFSPLLDSGLDKKFPFSLPWDVKRSVEMLLVDREVPKWKANIKGVDIVIDFEIFTSLAKIVRSFSTLVFVLLLILITRGIIKG